MKLEKEVYIGNINCHNLYLNGEIYRKSVSINILSNEFNDEEVKLLKKIQENYKVKLTLEVEEPILNEEEREYLSGVIRPFRDRITSIALEDIDDTELLQMIIYYDDNIAYFTLPPFKIGLMYKNMELNKEYTLEELGL